MDIKGAEFDLAGLSCRLFLASLIVVWAIHCDALVGCSVFIGGVTACQCLCHCIGVIPVLQYLSNFLVEHTILNQSLVFQVHSKKLN